jgi:hypothetical protein
LGIALIMEIAFGETLMVLGRPRFSGAFRLIVMLASFTSVHLSLQISPTRAPVSFATCRNVAVLLRQACIRLSSSASVGMKGSFGS